MFDRVLYKRKAKDALKGSWKAPVCVSLVQIFVALCGTALCRASHKSLPTLLLALALQGVASIAAARYFLRFSRAEGQKPAFEFFVEGFENWLSGLCTFLWTALWFALWALLLVVPGFVRLVAYSQAMFIVAENPRISARKALRMSIAMTQGHKSDLFLMYMSFAGWFVLCALTFGVGFAWLLPYMQLASANAYAYLKQRALASGAVSQADFLTNQKQ